MMKTTMNGHRLIYRATTLILAMAMLVAMSAQMRAATGSCAGGAVINLPFTDVQGNAFFCQIAAAYFSGLTNGTTATTYTPGAPVAREQMAAFVSRTLDQSLKRGSRRAALDQWWLAKDDLSAMKKFAFSSIDGLVKSDGKDLWALGESAVYRIDPIQGKVLGIYDSPGPLVPMNSLRGLLVAKGKVYAVGGSAGVYRLYQINPDRLDVLPSSVNLLTSDLGVQPNALSFDGKQFWTANKGGSVSLIDPANNFSVTTIPLGVQPTGILFDGNNIWVTDSGNGNLLKMDAFGFVIQTVELGGELGFPIFDGTNIWVPDTSEGKVYVVRASNGVLLATLQFNTTHNFLAAAFDGERVAVTDTRGYVHLWRATDFTYLGNLATDASSTPYGICNDGKHFWVGVTNNDDTAYLLGF
jgi:YVTN family beta-propeller protein